MLVAELDNVVKANIDGIFLNANNQSGGSLGWSGLNRIESFTLINPGIENLFHVFSDLTSEVNILHLHDRSCTDNFKDLTSEVTT